MTSDSYRALAISDRSGHDESVHFGAVVLIDREGRTMLSVGDPEVEIYPRSSLKPLQAFAMLEAGLDLPDELLALVCSSHDGRPMHIEGVRRILDSVELDESALANTPDLPLATDESERVLASGGHRRSILQNCSGKHAGMLATCRAQGWPTENYLDPSHPLQQGIAAGIAHLSGSPVPHIGIDGCGAPTHVMRLVDVARSFGSIASGAAGRSGEHIFRAMTSHPDMVGGPGHTTTEIMRSIPGLMLKDGAEGVLVGGFSDGRALAVKVADGSSRPRPAVMRTILDAFGVDTASIDPHLFDSPVLGHGRRVGGVRCVGELAAFVDSMR